MSPQTNIYMTKTVEAAGVFVLPKFYIALVLLLTVWPIAFVSLGWNLGAEQPITKSSVLALLNVPEAQFEAALFKRVSGTFLHGILEWTSVVIACAAAFLAFMHYTISRDVTSPIIGIALLCCGVMDGFHMLAAFHWVDAAADPHALIPFTWALARGFDALVITLGAFICLKYDQVFEQSGRHIVLIITSIFAGMAYSLIYLTALSPVLPQTQFPGAMLTRPFDVVPLFVYIISLPLFWRLYKAKPNYLTASLLLALIPYIALEMHMAFGSSELFDAHFNIAHGLKVLAYLIPFIGLTLDFVRAFQSEKLTAMARHENESQLVAAMAALKKSNDDLQHFAYSASHDLKSPLRAIHSLSSWLSEDLEGKIDEENQNRIALLKGRATRMEDLLKSMLAYTRQDDLDKTSTVVNAYKIAANAVDMLGVPQGFGVIIDEDMRDLRVRNPQINQVFMNLIGNAVKHHDKPSGVVNVSGRAGDKFHQFTVKDDGPGVPEEYHSKIFEMFQTLRRRDEVEGSGMGLALVKKIVLKAGGEIRLESTMGQGSRFVFTWPAAKIV